jgi:hypothetical protein
MDGTAARFSGLARVLVRVVGPLTDCWRLRVPGSQASFFLFPRFLSFTLRLRAGDIRARGRWAKVKPEVEPYKLKETSTGPDQLRRNQKTKGRGRKRK